ncbi:MAG: aminopeptidase [Firmicutes bacterium]|nr:aminopeptidase [Bacillota bacterium]
MGVLIEKKNGYDVISEAEKAKMEDYCKAYIEFMNNAKTERECVNECIELAEARGFKPYEAGMKLKPGDKVYYNNRGKNIDLAVIGRRPLNEGANIAAAHTDSPRLDLKPNPLYEDSEMAYLKTHYYGGVKKYQWVTIPLELHGVICKADGTKLEVKLGEGDEPKFVITDLLPHLGRRQMEKPMSEAITAENLNLLIGSVPVTDPEAKARYKQHVMELLNEKYGIVEEDLLSAELETVPAFKATEIGFDRSLIGAYGHDDRVCAFAEFKALLDIEGVPERTAVCIFADKEEVGSQGVTGMRSEAFEHFMNDLCKAEGVDVYDCFKNSFCLSADVTAAMDPIYGEVFEKYNDARINHGIGIFKYSGARGKSGASDASAETVAYLRNLFNENGVLWQLTEMGKIDEGGGGTVALYMANRNIETIDAGVPVLSMHAPFEVVAKLDCYMTYKGCKAVFEAK